MVVNVLICLIILTSQCVHSKVININNDDGTNSTECCVNGMCVCSSLYTALVNIASNTIINVTSKSVAMNNATTMGSGRLANITITGSNVTIMCNNSGSLYCESCNNVTIEGITWDSCGNPNRANIAGVTFNGTSNISLVNCTFQHSQTTAVSLSEVSNYIFIQHCKFLSNMLMQYKVNYRTLDITRSARYSSKYNSSVTIEISKSYFYNNGYHQNLTGIVSQPSLSIDFEDNSTIRCNITLEKIEFMSNRNAINFNFPVLELVNVQLHEILIVNNSCSNGKIKGCIRFVSECESCKVVLSSSNFSGNYGSILDIFIVGNKASFTINNSSFTDGKPASIGLGDDVDGAITISSYGGNTEINMHKVNFTSNQYSVNNLLSFSVTGNQENGCTIFVTECEFRSNILLGSGKILLIDIIVFDDTDVDDVKVQIENTNFDHNIAGSSVVYVTLEGNGDNIDVNLSTVSFANNIASSLHVSACDICLYGFVQFKNNTAESGGAMYLSQGSTVTIGDEATVHFIANIATLNGGAIYVDSQCDGDCTFDIESSNYSAVFTNNSATIVGNSLYFNIPRSCPVITNISDSVSILYMPCQFNYSQPVSGKMMHNISCDQNYTLFNGTGAPIVTSPHELRLYFPYNEGYDVSSTSKRNNAYFIKDNILGHQVKFTGAVFDYFGKLAEPTLFNIQLQCSNTSDCSNYTLIGGDHNHILTHSIDNITIPEVSFQGNRIGNAKHINLTLTLSSMSYSFEKVSTTLVVQLIPCHYRPGYMYSDSFNRCVCYNHTVKCENDFVEIERGY